MTASPLLVQGGRVVSHEGVQRADVVLRDGVVVAVVPDGTAFEGDRMFVTRGRDIPKGGGCFDFPGGATRPKADCEGMKERAARELQVSRAVVDYDLHRELDD